ncbi:hypothetical protein RO787_05400 [Blautia coccoides]|nr:MULTISPECIES: hypothetical protein [Blautia]MDT4372783.1 hypothetical protein [Blautia coccoides]
MDVYEYLKYLLTEMPNNNHLEYPSVIDRNLSWSEELLLYTTPCFEALTNYIQIATAYYGFTF